MQRPNGEFCYQAVFTGTVERFEPFVATDEDEMSDIMLWDLKRDIGYVDECDLKIVEIVCDENGKPSIKRIRDMQIVNGGQTTASIANL